MRTPQGMPNQELTLQERANSMQEVGLTHSTPEAGNDRRGKGLAEGSL